MDVVDEERYTSALVPATPLVAPNPPSVPNRIVFTDPITIVPPQAVQSASRHGAIVVATLVSSTKLFDVVVKTKEFAPIVALSQLTGIVTSSWIFGKTTLDLLETHGVERSLMVAAERDTSILLRAVVLLLVRRVVKIEGFSRVGDMLALFQFVKVGAALAESQRGTDDQASRFLNDIASIPIKVFSVVAALASSSVDIRLRKAIALAIGEVLKTATSQLALVNDRVNMTTRNVEEMFYRRYGWMTRNLYMQLQFPSGVSPRDVLLEWKGAV